MKLDIQAIRDLLDETTGGPWFIDGQDYHAIRANHVVVCPFVAKVERNEFDAQFIVSAKQIVPALLDEIERLRGALEVLQDNMHQTLGYTALCPECERLLPKHADDCELVKAMSRQALEGDAT